MCDIPLEKILREVHPVKGFVYCAATWDEYEPKTLRVNVEPRNWTTSQRARMHQIEGRALRTLKAFLLVETFQHFWTYRSPTWAGKFLEAWCSNVARSWLDPLKKVARSLTAHRRLLLNYFEAKKRFSSGVVEGLNAKIKLTLKRSYGFRTDNARQLARFHALGKLPEPQFTHSFF